MQLADFARGDRIVVGIDLAIVPEAVQEAKGYSLITGQWEDLAGESYDAGYSHHCLEHLRDPVGALHEWARIIRPGGNLFLSVPCQVRYAVASHLTQGYTIPHLAYLLAVSGFDCRNGSFSNHAVGIWAIVGRGEDISIIDTTANGWCGVERRLPPALQPSGASIVCDRDIIA